MNKKWLIGLVVALLTAGLAASVSAGPYVAGNFGLVAVSDATLTSPAPSGKMSTNPGFGFMAAIGNGFDNLRAEVEVAYRSNDLDKVYSTPSSGKITSLSGMGNLLFDLDLSESVRPFLGAGMGLANLDTNDNNLNNANDLVFAYQIIAGLGLPLSHVTTLDLQYRYFATTNPDFDGKEVEYQSNNFFAGLRFDF